MWMCEGWKVRDNSLCNVTMMAVDEITWKFYDATDQLFIARIILRAAMSNISYFPSNGSTTWVNIWSGLRVLTINGTFHYVCDGNFDLLDNWKEVRHKRNVSLIIIRLRLN